MKDKIIHIFGQLPKQLKFGRLFLLLIFISIISTSIVSSTEKMMIVVIDGARYSETFGDPNHTYIPNMWNLSKQGTVLENFYNDSLTFTARAIPALWCGSWTEVRDTVHSGFRTNFTVKPTMFEYFRKQKNLPAESCYYVLKFIQNLWLPSFDPLYGPDFWPTFHSLGTSDDEVTIQALHILDNHHPHFIWVYLADVDSYGHSGDWDKYTAAITKADSIAGILWAKLQLDPFYRNSTTLFVTNDHGRHDDSHGGFKGHGDDCEGCRRIQFLAIGPGIKQNFVSKKHRRIPDMSVTVAKILDIDPGQATGDLMVEIFKNADDKSQNSSLKESKLDN